MFSEQIIQAEKEYLVNVLGKKLIDSEERCKPRQRFKINGKEYRGHNGFARLLFPEEFLDGTLKHVHHINGVHSDNRACNIVVLTPSEHSHIHMMFDPKFQKIKEDLRNPSDEIRQKIRNTIVSSGCCAGENNPMYGHNHNDEAKQQIGIKNRQHHKDNPEKYKKQKSELHKKHLSESFIKNGSHKGKNNSMYGKPAASRGTRWMNNGKDEMRVFPPWDKDMLIFGWQYGRLKRKA